MGECRDYFSSFYFERKFTCWDVHVLMFSTRDCGFYLFVRAFVRGGLNVVGGNNVYFRSTTFFWKLFY